MEKGQQQEEPPKKKLTLSFILQVLFAAFFVGWIAFAFYIYHTLSEIGKMTPSQISAQICLWAVAGLFVNFEQIHSIYERVAKKRESREERRGSSSLMGAFIGGAFGVSLINNFNSSLHPMLIVAVFIAVLALGFTLCHFLHEHSALIVATLAAIHVYMINMSALNSQSTVQSTVLDTKLIAVAGVLLVYGITTQVLTIHDNREEQYID